MKESEAWREIAERVDTGGVYFLCLNADALADEGRIGEKLRDPHTHWTIANFSDGWHVRVKRTDNQSRKVFYGEHADESLPLAICLAALMALGAK